MALVRERTIPTEQVNYVIVPKIKLIFYQVIYSALGQV